MHPIFVSGDFICVLYPPVSTSSDMNMSYFPINWNAFSLGIYDEIGICMFFLP